MGLRIELLQPDPDGTNDTFTVPFAYEPSTTRLFVNGQLKYEADDDGFIQSNPGIGEIKLKEIPYAGDRLQLLFEDLFTQGVTFNPILAFDVTLELSIPASLCAEVVGAVVVPRDLQIEGEIDTAPMTPAGFCADDPNPAPSCPAGISYEDLDFVSIPRGFVLERT